ncbi:MAG TPA: SDR family NAD(P)-dependent oxidoreductase [Actinocrinis sp.]|nr:SDR family NAD(P)-dependent oxidoreductase [Actinocrinis sp.]
MVRRWLVTGCSSGLGKALAIAAARAGDRLVVTARQPAALAELAEAWPDNIIPVALDIRDEHQCQDAVAAAIEHLGGIDVLVNNAGGGLFGAVEEICDDELRDQLETLIVAPWRLTRLVLPVMRGQGAGHIINVSSVAGRMAVPGLAAYVSGKHALEGMSQALATEVEPLGLRVTVLEPGGYATRYGTVLAEARTRLPAYAPVAEALGMFRGMEENPMLGRPDDFAEAVLALVAAEGPTPLRVPIGPGAHEMLGPAQQAALDELTAAGALIKLLSEAGSSQTPEAQAIDA